MEPLAFVEILGRHGDVLARHPVYRWPVRAGRGYDMDVILDDRFVAPRHVQIEPVTDGRFRVTDLDSVNGISLSPSAQRVGSCEVGPDDIVRLGQTQMRVRATSYGVRPEMRLRATAMYRRPLPFVILSAALLGLVALNTWISAVQQDEKLLMVFPVVTLCVGVGVWISLWSLVSRMVGGRANFAAHGFVACAGIIALELTDTLIGYASFGFHLRWLGYAGTAAAAVIFAYMLFRHLRLNSRAPRRRLGVIAGIVSVVTFGAFTGLEMAGDSAREGMQGYDPTVKPPAFLWVSGITPEAFLGDGARLKRKVDALARAAP